MTCQVYPVNDGRNHQTAHPNFVLFQYGALHHQLHCLLKERGKLFTHSLPHSLTHSPTHPLTYSPTHSPLHSLTCSLTHPLTHSLTHLFTRSLTHSLTPSLSHPFTHSPAPSGWYASSSPSSPSITSSSSSNICCLKFAYDNKTIKSQTTASNPIPRFFYL